MLCKYYLQLGTTTLDISSADCMEVGTMIKNIENLTVSYTRTDLGGVVRKCGSSIEFVGDAYDALVSHYKENYLKSSGAFAVYTIDNNWNYSKLWECPLDFATFQYTSYVATISCVDNSVAAVIKAKRRTKYDISITSTETSIAYQGVETKREATFYLTGADAADFYAVNQRNERYTYSTGDMYAKYSQGSYYSAGTWQAMWPTVGLNKSGYKSQQIALFDPDGGHVAAVTSEDGIVASAIEAGGYIAECLKSAQIYIQLYFNVKVGLTSSSKLVLYSGTRKLKEWGPYRETYSSDSYSGKCEASINEYIQMYTGEKLFFGMITYANSDSSVTGQSLAWSQSTNYVHIYEASTATGTKYLSCCSAQELLQGILNKMFPQTGEYVRGVISNSNTTLNRTKLVAAERIRGTGSDYITTFNDFCDFMESVFGFVYTITTRKDLTAEQVTAISSTATSIVDVSFKHRSEVFSNDIIKQLEGANNLNYSIDDSRAYSTVDVGYAKVDYDNNNSAGSEFNFTHYYETGITLTDNALSLISPYRADCYGIEELLLKTASTENTKSDDDIFLIVVASEKTGGYYTADKSTNIGTWVISWWPAYSRTFKKDNTVFNALLAPNIIVQNNKEYIACFTDTLKFASSDGNSSYYIDEIAMNSNVSINGQMFKAGKISIDTDDMVLPESWDGVVKFELNKKTYQGYLESIDINFAKSGTITYNLIEKCIE